MIQPHISFATEGSHQAGWERGGQPSSAPPDPFLPGPRQEDSHAVCCPHHGQATEEWMFACISKRTCGNNIAWANLRESARYLHLALHCLPMLAFCRPARLEDPLVCIWWREDSKADNRLLKGGRAFIPPPPRFIREVRHSWHRVFGWIHSCRSNWQSNLTGW